MSIMDDREGDPLHHPAADGSAETRPGVATVHVLPRPAKAEIVAFDRRELRSIMNIYGKMVAAGEWRDYAMDFTPTRAVFSIFRRTSEVPLYRIEKDPKLARKQGMYSVTAASGLVLKRGQELDRVLAVLDKQVRLVVV